MYNHELKATNYLFNTTRTVMVKIRITYEQTNKLFQSVAKNSGSVYCTHV